MRLSEIISWYVEFIEMELGKLEDGGFTGNVFFQINLKDGLPRNMNVDLKKFVCHLKGMEL